MTEVCRVAGLTERYFYESFRSREDLHGALIDDLDQEVREAAFDAVASDAVAPEERLHAATRAVVDLYVGDPRRGRVALIGGIGVPELEERRRAAVVGLFGLIAERWPLFFPHVDVDEEERGLRATAIGGATIALITARLEGSLTIDGEVLVAAIVRSSRAIAEADVPPG
jgi:AcrR family transcriptional regulator